MPFTGQKSMDIENYSYIWGEKKTDFVLVKTDLGYGIINKKEQTMLLMSDEEMEQKIVNKMLENGNKIYDDIKKAYNDV